MAEAIQVLIDVAEPRISTDRMAHLVNGNDWDLFADVATNAGVDIVTATGMLLPLPFDTTWQTSSSGNYARLAKADYTLTTSDWDEQNVKFDGDVYLRSKDNNEIVRTNASYPKNRAFFLSWYVHSSGTDAYISMECGWGQGTDADVRLRFWSDGNVEFWRNDVFLGTSRITDVTPYTSRLGYQGVDKASPGRNLANQFVSVCLIPCRKREMLILADTGGGCNFLFEEIDDVSDPDPTICGAGQFRWQVPQGQAVVQCAPLRYATSGVLIGPEYALRFAPPSGMTHTETVYYDTPGYGANSATVSLKKSNGTTAFTPDGSSYVVRLRVDLTGDGESTPFVYGAATVFDRITANTAAGNYDITSYVREMQLEVPEDPENVELTIKLANPDLLEALGVSNIARVSNRPVRVMIGSKCLFEGRTEKPKYKQTISDYSDTIEIRVRDRMQAFDKYTIRDPVPEDGVNAASQIAIYAKMPGYSSSDLDIGTIDFEMPSVTAPSKGEWARQPTAGDTSLKRIKALWQDYAQTYWYGWYPAGTVTKFRFKHPDEIGTAANGTIFGGMPEAIDYLLNTVGYGTAAALGSAYQYVYRQFSEDTLPPEANGIYVVGRDPRTKLPLIAQDTDAASSNPETAVASRPDNWVGEPWRYQLQSEAFTDQQTCNYCAAVLRERLEVTRQTATWDSELLRDSSGIPLWRGSVAKLTNKGRYRITSLSCKFVAEVEDASTGGGTILKRNAQYKGEYIGA